MAVRKIQNGQNYLVRSLIKSLVGIVQFQRVARLHDYSKGDKVFQLILVSIQGVKSIVIPHSNRLACKNILLSSFEPC